MSPIEDLPIGKTPEQKDLPIGKVDLGELYADALSRVQTKEIKAVQRAIRKCTGYEFMSWANEFYQKHVGTVRESFGPVMRANREERRLDSFAQAHCREHLQQLALAAWTDNPQAAVDHLCETWRNYEQSA